jgi:hypothetical protein
MSPPRAGAASLPLGAEAVPYAMLLPSLPSPLPQHGSGDGLRAGSAGIITPFRGGVNREEMDGS